MDGSGTLFGEFAAALGARTIIASYPRDRALDYEALDRLVEALLPRDEPYVLLGESFSGPIAIRIAARRPAGLRAVILVCTFAMLGSKRAPTFVRALISQLPFWKLPVSFGTSVLLGRWDSTAMRSKLRAAIKFVAPVVWRTRLRSVLEVDVTSQLRLIEVPLLYLRASEDRLVPIEAAKLVLNSNPLVRLVTVKGPHGLLQTQPEPCARAIREFAQQVGIAW